MKKLLYILFISLGLILFSLSSCSLIEGMGRNPNYLYEDGALLVDGADQPIILKNNPQAVNVTFAELLTFIRQDITDQIPYVERGSTDGQVPFVCADFAEAVHNNAETAGIRAGYVSIDWEDGSVGHAVNAFETLDKGIVYIDCTGSSAYSQLEETEDSVALASWDKVAYIQIGSRYGIIGLDYATEPYYYFFENYDEKWQELKTRMAAYNVEVKKYNQEIANTVFYEGTSEIARIRNWEATLKAEEKELDTLIAEIGDARFRPLSIVKSINVHW